MVDIRSPGHPLAAGLSSTTAPPHRTCGRFTDRLTCSRLAVRGTGQPIGLTRVCGRLWVITLPRRACLAIAAGAAGATSVRSLCRACPARAAITRVCPKTRGEEGPACHVARPRRRPRSSPIALLSPHRTGPSNRKIARVRWAQGPAAIADTRPRRRGPNGNSTGDPDGYRQRSRLENRRCPGWRRCARQPDADRRGIADQPVAHTRGPVGRYELAAIGHSLPRLKMTQVIVARPSAAPCGARGRVASPPWGQRGARAAAARSPRPASALPRRQAAHDGVWFHPGARRQLVDILAGDVRYRAQVHARGRRAGEAVGVDPGGGGSPMSRTAGPACSLAAVRTAFSYRRGQRY